jgi:hypothetical protein
MHAKASAGLGLVLCVLLSVLGNRTILKKDQEATKIDQEARRRKTTF